MVFTSSWFLCQVLDTGTEWVLLPFPAPPKANDRCLSQGHSQTLVHMNTLPLAVSGQPLPSPSSLQGSAFPVHLPSATAIRRVPVKNTLGFLILETSPGSSLGSFLGTRHILGGGDPMAPSPQLLLSPWSLG